MAYNIPHHCSHAIVFQKAMMLVFDPITLPFTFQTRDSNAEDFWVDNCLSCGLRVGHCNNIIGNCILNKKPKCTEGQRTIEISYPTHVIIMQIYDSSDIKIGFDDNDCLYPMRLGNIYEAGSWCYGDINLDKKDPTAIYRGFFNGIHNTDLTEFSRSDTREYEKYLVSVSQNFLSNIERTEEPISMHYYGDVIHIQEKPRKIEYMYNREPNSVPVKGRYVIFS